jgi:hypothetical protein
VSAHTHTERVRPLAPIPQTERQGPLSFPAWSKHARRGPSNNPFLIVLRP